MLELPEFADEDRDEIASLVREHPWAMVASAVDGVPPHGYVTPTWYPPGTCVPTWNFVRVHLHGVAEILDADATWDVLERTVAHFEHERPRPWSLTTVDDYAHRIAPGTVGFRLRTSRIVAKAKLSQDKPDAIVRSVVAGLEHDEVHAKLAATMRRGLLEPNGGPR